MSDKVIPTPPHVEPVVFTRDMLDWLPWLEPMAEHDLSARHMAGLVDAARAKSAYFRLLVRDPEVLEHRTKTDKDIFYNPEAGLPRAERELAAAATSRFNGCIYCASVHARFASTYSKRREDVQKLLDEGVNADLGARWNAVVKASVALAATPIAFGPENIAELRNAGLDDGGVLCPGGSDRCCVVAAGYRDVDGLGRQVRAAGVTGRVVVRRVAERVRPRLLGAGHRDVDVLAGQERQRGPVLDLDRQRDRGR